jgi:hypothetical protein
MIKLHAASRLLASEDSEWWDDLGDEEQKTYVDEHPNSRYADDYHPSGSKPASKPAAPAKPASKPSKPSSTSGDPDKPETVNKQETPKKPAPSGAPKPHNPETKNPHESLKDGLKPPPKTLETPKALLEGPGGEAEPEETTKPKKKKWNPDEEKSLTKYLLHKGGQAAKKKAKELVKKGGHEMIRRLLDPLELTDIGKKGELPELPFKFKSKEGKIKDLQGKRAKLRKQMKGYGKNVPQKLKDQMKELSDKLEGLQED